MQINKVSGKNQNFKAIKYGNNKLFSNLELGALTLYDAEFKKLSQQLEKEGKDLLIRKESGDKISLNSLDGASKEEFICEIFGSDGIAGFSTEKLKDRVKAKMRTRMQRPKPISKQIADKVSEPVVKKRDIEKFELEEEYVFTKDDISAMVASAMGTELNKKKTFLDKILDFLGL